MKLTRIALLLLIAFAIIQPVFAQSNEPLAILMTADGAIMPPMLEYFKRGIETAERKSLSGFQWRE